MTEVRRSPKTFTSEDTFTLCMGNARYVFESDIFAKMSKKCAKLIRQGVHQATIMKKIRQDTFEAFIAACQLQPFKVSAANVYELLDLARDWQVSSLEKFANDFIESKKGKLQPPPAIDYIQVLKDRVNENIQDINDIRAVAAIINEALTDARFSTLPPEVIFHVILAADPHEIDQQLLVNFVFTMFDKKASTAVPLTLTMDFDMLSPEQRDKVFFSKKMHEENIDFFVAWALSAARNHSERELQETFSKFHQDFSELYDSLKKSNRNSRNKLKKAHEDEIAQMKEIIAKQREEIDQLILQAKEEDEQIKEDEIEHQEEIRKMNAELEKIESIASECNLNSPDSVSQVKSVVSDEVGKVKKDLKTQIENVRALNRSNCDKTFDDLMKPIDEYRKVIDDMLNKSGQMNESIEDLRKSITNLKATLTAKIVCDKLRCDKFIRDTDNRFELFDSKPLIWNLQKQQVEGSEKFIISLEEKLDKLCPIRGNQQLNPPQTPMAALLSQKNDDLPIQQDEEFGAVPLSTNK